jgi:hypothetical protein
MGYSMLQTTRVAFQKAYEMRREGEEEIMESYRKHVYNLKLDMLLAVLGANRQTCELWTEVTASALAFAKKTKGISGNSIASIIELSIIQGRIHSCVILDMHKQQITFHGQAALELCALCGELAWSVRPDRKPPTPVLLPQRAPSKDDGNRTGQTRSNKDPLPFRVTRFIDFTQEQLSMLPRKDRQVWMVLSNGPREIHELCQILQLSKERLIPILNKLATLNIIRYMHEE